ncbi:MAG: CehA/McbA family metallohydrolase [Anaerolineales bacterium]|jgi:hypothetical protein
MFEYVGNLHAHTPYSDGHADHEQVAMAAIHAGLDFVAVTDHNVFVHGLDGYRYLGDQRVLLIVGEEAHDQAREPQRNHLLIYEAKRELATYAYNPQQLIDMATKAGGITFLAHPFEEAAPLIGEDALGWVDWQVEGYAGLEIWNFMSEFKSLLKSVPATFYYAYNPDRIAVGPPPETLARWDELLASGKRVVAIGGADAHGLPVRSGPFRRVVFPYEYLFRAVNTHVITDQALTGDADQDRLALFQAIQRGRCFVGYDLPARTYGFRFTAQSDDGQAIMGDQIAMRFGATLQVRLPQSAEIHLLRDGQIEATWDDADAILHLVREPGVYRVEAYVFYKGKRRGWIFSNPIFVTA